MCYTKLKPEFFFLKLCMSDRCPSDIRRKKKPYHHTDDSFITSEQPCLLYFRKKDATIIVRTILFVLLHITMAELGR